jgi:hypothetical protein
MKPKTKIRFTETQIALLLQAHPNCNLDHLTELSFEFDHAGRVVDCVGRVREGANIGHDFTGSGLARFYERARHQLTGRQTGAIILKGTSKNSSCH